MVCTTYQHTYNTYERTKIMWYTGCFNDSGPNLKFEGSICIDRIKQYNKCIAKQVGYTKLPGERIYQTQLCF